LVKAEKLQEAAQLRSAAALTVEAARRLGISLIRLNGTVLGKIQAKSSQLEAARLSSDLRKQKNGPKRYQ
jgi:hypothetical protein